MGRVFQIPPTIRQQSFELAEFFFIDRPLSLTALRIAKEVVN